MATASSGNASRASKCPASGVRKNHRYSSWRSTHTLRWSIDCADAGALSRARREIVEELSRSGSDAGKLFDLEIVLGEMFAAQAERGHLALAVTLERRGRSPSIHIYSQGRPLERVPDNAVRASILRATRVPMSIESSDQGTHICLRLLLGHEQPLRRMKVHFQTSKFSLSF